MREPTVNHVTLTDNEVRALEFILAQVAGGGPLREAGGSVRRKLLEVIPSMLNRAAHHITLDKVSYRTVTNLEVEVL